MAATFYHSDGSTSYTQGTTWVSTRELAWEERHLQDIWNACDPLPPIEPPSHWKNHKGEYRYRRLQSLTKEQYRAVRKRERDNRRRGRGPTRQALKGQRLQHARQFHR